MEHDYYPFQRRVRHITAIQVRNLTPFPVRDAFASALAKPSEQSQFTPHGRLSDDLDLTLSRRRSRRISANSINTLWSMMSEEGSGEDGSRGSGAGEAKVRRKGAQRMSFSSSGTNSGSPTLLNLPPSSAPTIRTANRHRTASLASSINSPFTVSSSLVSSTTPATTSTFSFLLPDHSQTGLEKVIKSRLVETFVAVTVLPMSASHEDNLSATTLSKDSSLPWPSPSTSKGTPVSRHKTTPPNGTRPTPKPSPLKSTNKAALRGSPSSPRPTHTKSVPNPKSPNSRSVRVNGKTSCTPSPTTPKSAVRPSTPSAQPKPVFPATPNYISAIHRPSTNPSFSVDARSGYEFSEWTDLSADQVKIELWGKVGAKWLGDGGDGRVNAKGKGKEKERGKFDRQAMAEDGDWKVLEEWNISLVDLVPLPKDVSTLFGSLDYALC